MYGAKPNMTTIIIVGLAGIAVYFGGAWMSSRHEVSQLRTHIAALKRHITRD